MQVHRCKGGVERFRIGASSLLNDVLMQWKRLDTGAYQSRDYIPED